MPRHSGGSASGNRASGGNTRRLHTRKNTYAAKQSHSSPYWVESQRSGVHTVQEREPRHRYPMPLGRPTAGRKNKPPGTKQKPKPRPKGGSK